MDNPERSIFVGVPPGTPLNKKNPYIIPIEWELIKEGCYRCKVIGGWVFINRDNQDRETSVFIPDKHHKWRIE